MIERPNVVLHVVGTEHVLGAEFFVGIHVGSADRAEDTPEACQTALLGAAGDCLHFLDHGAIGMLFVTRERGNRKNERAHCNQQLLSLH
jgi:hypothetical protein